MHGSSYTNKSPATQLMHAGLIEMNNVFWVTCAKAIYADQEL